MRNDAVRKAMAVLVAALLIPLPGLAQDATDDIEEWIPPPESEVATGAVPDEGGGGLVAAEKDAEDGSPPVPADAQVEPLPDEGAPVAPGEEVDINYFYEALSPYGEWMWTPEHGWVWKPNDVGENWRPYTYGRWLYTDSGWYWHSYWPWGWAPFHYGNWSHLDYIGWVWVPGTVWGPSWVLWRYSDDLVGWAPIPPGFGWGYGWGYYPVFYDSWIFLGWGHLCHHHPYHHFHHSRHSRDDFRHTYFPRRCREGASAGCMRGLAPKFVERHARTPVEKLRLSNLATRTDRPLGAPPKLTVGDGQVQVFKPAIRGKLNQFKPAAQVVGQPRPRVQDLGVLPPNNRVPDMKGAADPRGLGSPRTVDRLPAQGQNVFPNSPKVRQPNMPRESVRYQDNPTFTPKSPPVTPRVQPRFPGKPGGLQHSPGSSLKPKSPGTLSPPRTSPTIHAPSKPSGTIHRSNSSGSSSSNKSSSSSSSSKGSSSSSSSSKGSSGSHRHR